MIGTWCLSSLYRKDAISESAHMYLVFKVQQPCLRSGGDLYYRQQAEDVNRQNGQRWGAVITLFGEELFSMIIEHSHTHGGY